MRKTIALFIRVLLKIPALKKLHFGIHKKIIAPYNLFNGLVFHTKIHGLTFELHAEDWIQENLFLLGEYEKAELKLLTSILNEDSVFIDIGANIGLHTLIASKKINSQGKIISFEPYTTNFKQLITNLELNKAKNICLVKKAVSNQEGSAMMYYNTASKSLGMATLSTIPYDNKEEVETIQLDAFVAENKVDGVDIIKLDVEGEEYNALLGMRNTLNQFKPNLLIEILDSKELERVLSLLSNYGYKLYYISNEGELTQENKNTQRKNYFFKVE